MINQHRRNYLKRHRKALRRDASDTLFSISRLFVGLGMMVLCVCVLQGLSGTYFNQGWSQLWFVVLAMSWPLGVVFQYMFLAVLRLTCHRKLSQSQRRRFVRFWCIGCLPINVVLVFYLLATQLVYRHFYFLGVLDNRWQVAWGLLLSIIVVLVSLWEVRLWWRFQYRVKWIEFGIPLVTMVVFIVALNGIFFQAFSKRAYVADLNEVAILLSALGQYQKANDMFTEALAKRQYLKPAQVAQVLQNKADSLIQQQSFDEAMFVYQEALIYLSDQNMDHHLINGKLAFMLSEIPEAISMFERVLRFDENHSEALFHLGIIYSGHIDPKWQDLSQALRYTRQSYQVRPNDISRQHLAVNYFRLGQFNNALPLWEQIAIKHPEHAQSHYYLGLTQYHTGNTAAAQESLLIATSRDISFFTPEVESILGQSILD